MDEKLEGQEEQPQNSDGANQKSKKTALSGISSYFIEFLKIFIVAAAIIVPIRLFLIQPFYVKGASMEPNFFENEYLVIDKLSPHFMPYKRGEVVVFRYPKNENRFLIKRVIGLPGERVVVQKEKITIFNAEHPDGFVLDESSYTPYELRPENAGATLGSSEYFVLGDNRPVSYDSERFGAVDKSQIVGRVEFRGLPINRIGVFNAPEYNN